MGRLKTVDIAAWKKVDDMVTMCKTVTDSPPHVGNFNQASLPDDCNFPFVSNGRGPKGRGHSVVNVNLRRIFNEANGYSTRNWTGTRNNVYLLAIHEKYVA
jgi:hypothetical protein